MSKSKLNRRQLKKISKLASEYIIYAKGDTERSKMVFDKYGEDGFIGEYGFWYVGGYEEEYYSYSALSTIFHEFLDRFINWQEMSEDDTQMIINPPKGFRSLSYANAVHYIIKMQKSYFQYQKKSVNGIVIHW